MLLAQMLLMAAARKKTYQQVILADKPVAFWPLNETSGTVAHDISGNGNNAAYQNTPTLGAAPLAAGLGPSITLNGSTQYVELASPPALLQIVEGSFEGWVQPENVGSTFGGILTTQYTDTTVNFALSIAASLQGGDATSWTFANYGTSWTMATDASTATNGDVYHLVGTFDGTTLLLYVNGVKVASIAVSAFTPTPNSIFMGRGDYQGYTEGGLSNVAMYSTILTATQIQNHYNAGIA